jgi:cell division protein ZapE
MMPDAVHRRGYRDQLLDVHADAAPERMLDSEEPPYDAARTLSRLATLSPAATT